MSDDQKRLLEKQLWAVADTLRSSMNADEYRNYILGFIFYKYLSEKQESYAQSLLKADRVIFKDLRENKKQDKEYIEAIKEASLEKLGFFLSPSQLFSELVKKGKGDNGEDKFILEDLKAVLNSIEQTSSGTDSEDDFKGLFADVDLTSVRLGSTEKIKNERIVEVLGHLSKIDFKLEDAKSDVLGDAYEYLIAQFAAGAGKKAGEFYTPPQVSRLMAQIVTDGKKKLRSVYDPTCGSGSLLLRLSDYAEISNYYGQEYNTTTYNLARMNMILHGIHYTRFKIENGNTLTDDRLPELKAEAVVANPPFSATWKGDADPVLASDERFSQYGRLPPKGYADYAFVTHMLHHLADNGTMTVVLPHGVLYRDNAEGIIREYLIKKLNYLDTVIGLPENLFYGTGIPALILVFKKCRKVDDSILFIDASRDYRAGVNRNYLENVDKIYETYQSRKDITGYSRNISIEEISSNEFNLNIPRYIDTYKDNERADLEYIVKKLERIAGEEKKLLNKIDKFCNELNIPFSKGNNIELLKQYRDELVIKLLSHEIAFKDKKYSGWETKKLGDLFTEISEKAGNDDYDLLSISLARGITPYNSKAKRDSSSEDKSNYKVVRPGHIAYNTMRMWQGASGVSTLTGIISPAYTVVNVINGDSRFFGYLFKLPRTIFDFYRYSQGLTSDTWNLKFKHFSEVTVYVPKSIEEQVKIADFISTIDTLIEVKTKDIGSDIVD